MPWIDFAALRSAVRLAQVLELLGFVATSRHGPQVRGPCPLHASAAAGTGPRRKSRSFAAHLQRNCWHCFGCGAHGNALDLWVAATRLPVYAAALDLCRRLHVDVPRLPSPPSPLVGEGPAVRGTVGSRPASRSPPAP